MDAHESSSSPLIDSYAAGLIDGEGYIGIQEAGGSFQVRLKIGMTDKGLPALRRMVKHYGGKINLDRHVGEKTRETHVWRLTGQSASNLIRALIPMLAVKQEPAQIALRFQAMVDQSPRLPNGRASWTPQMRSLAAEFRRRIQEANRRGPDPSQSPPINLPQLAIYGAGSWWEPDDSLFGPVEYSGQIPPSGVVHRGVMYSLPTEPLAKSPTLMPTPRTSDTNGAGRHGSGGPDLRTVVTGL